jgi:hypothetical protein
VNRDNSYGLSVVFIAVNKDGKRQLWIRSLDALEAQVGVLVSRWPGGSIYEVTADGQRFLIITPVEEASPSPFTVVLNWTAGLRR